MAVAAGHERWVRMSLEGAWGTIATSPTWLLIPVTEYGVALTSEARTTDVMLGLEQVRFGQHFHSKRTVSGPVRTFAYPVQTGAVPLVETLIDWAMTRTLGELKSYTMEDYTRFISGRHLRHLGCVVQGLTIAASNDAPELAMDLDIHGRYEQNIAGGSPEVLTPPVDGPYIWQSSSLMINDGAVSMDSFSVAIANNVAVRWCNAYDPSYHRAGRREVTLTFAMPYENNTYTEMLRSMGDLEFDASFVHPVKATTAGAELAGAGVVVEVDHVYKFVVGDDVYIYDDSDSEWTTVEAVSKTNKTLTLTLVNGYDAGAIVTKGKVDFDLKGSILDATGRRFTLNDIDTAELTLTVGKTAGQNELVYTVA